MHTDAKERTPYTPKLFKQKRNHLKRAQKTNFTHTDPQKHTF